MQDLIVGIGKGTFILPWKGKKNQNWKKKIKKSHAVRSNERLCFDFCLKHRFYMLCIMFFCENTPCLIYKNKPSPQLWFCIYDCCLSTGNMRGNLFQISLPLILSGLFSQIPKITCLCPISPCLSEIHFQISLSAYTFSNTRPLKEMEILFTSVPTY